jgi:hypothetical protein
MGPRVYCFLYSSYTSAVDVQGKSGHAATDFLILINFSLNIKLSGKLFIETR